MSLRSDALLWAQRVVGRKGAAPHQLLEIAPDAGLEAAQEAFQRIARMAHPDLHRTTLSPDELELMTTAYARVAAAYQDIRASRTPSGRLPPIRPGSSDPLAPPTQSPRATTLVPVNKTLPPTNKPLPPTSRPIEDPASAQMTSKALVHFRKAELSLRRGDLSAAVLQLRMAIASDPQSAFLRTAMAEVEAELRKKP